MAVEALTAAICWTPVSVSPAAQKAEGKAATATALQDQRVVVGGLYAPRSARLATADRGTNQPGPSRQPASLTGTGRRTMSFRLSRLTVF